MSLLHIYLDACIVHSDRYTVFYFGFRHEAISLPRDLCWSSSYNLVRFESPPSHESSSWNLWWHQLWPPLKYRIPSMFEHASGSHIFLPSPPPKSACFHLLLTHPLSGHREGSTCPASQHPSMCAWNINWRILKSHWTWGRGREWSLIVRRGNTIRRTSQDYRSAKTIVRLEYKLPSRIGEAIWDMKDIFNGILRIHTSF